MVFPRRAFGEVLCNDLSRCVRDFSTDNSLWVFLSLGVPIPQGLRVFFCKELLMKNCKTLEIRLVHVSLLTEK